MNTLAAGPLKMVYVDRHAPAGKRFIVRTRGHTVTAARVVGTMESVDLGEPVVEDGPSMWFQTDGPLHVYHEAPAGGLHAAGEAARALF